MPDSKLWMATILGIVIAVIVIFSIIAGTSSTMIDSARSITDANNCSTADDSNGTALVYNYTDKYCYNVTGASLENLGRVYTAGQTDLPLNTMFSETGVIFIAFMAALFIGVIAFVLGMKLKGR